MAFLILFRIHVIAVKYALFSPEKIAFYKSVILIRKYLEKD